MRKIRISSTELARSLGDVLNRVHYRGESFIVERSARKSRFSCRVPEVDLGDAIRTLSALFRSGPASSCPDAADVDDGGSIDLTDPIYLLHSLFQGGPPPPSPGFTTGADPTPDGLGFCWIACP